MGGIQGMEGLDSIMPPQITPDMRECAITRVMRECDAPLLLDILGLGE